MADKKEKLIDGNLHLILDTLAAAVYTTDAKGRLTYFNQEAVHFSGRTPKLGSDHWCVTWKLYWPDGTPMPHEECPMAVSLKEGHSINGAEAIAERPDGKRIWFEAYPSPIRNEEGEIIGGVNMLLDITDQKQAEEELTDFFENVTVGLHWVGPDGIIQRVNQAEVDMLGYSRDEVVGSHIADLHADKEVIEDILQRLENGEELHEYEARLQCKDGSIRHVLINSNVYRKEGEFINTRCVTRDITERKQVEQALRKSEEKYRTLFETMEEGFCILKVEFDDNDEPVSYRYLETNTAFEKHTGLKDVEGESVNEVLPGLEGDLIRKYGKVALTGESIRFENYNDVLERWFNVSAFRMGEPKERKVAVFFRDITKRKMTEKALGESEYRYRTLFESIDQGFAIVDVDFDAEGNPEDIFLVKTNSAFEKNTGVKDAEGKTLNELASEQNVDLSSEWYDAMGKVAKSGESIRFEKQAEASGRYFDIFAFPFNHHSETKVAVLIDDITERKEHEFTNARLAAIVNSSQDAIISKDLDGIITTWNDAAKQMFGYTEEEAVGQPVTMLFPEDKIDEEAHILAKIGGGDQIDHYETVRLTKKNEPLNVSLSISPVVDSSGRVIGASKIARDITERKRTEEERERLLHQVENERERLESIFKRAPSFMCVLQGPDHVFERVNDLYYELIDKREVIGKSVLEALPEVKGQGFIEKLDEVYQTGKPFHAKDMPIALKRGSDNDLENRYVNLVYQPLYEPDGSISGIFVQGLDITERKQAEQDLRKSEEKYRTLFESMDEGYCIIEMIFDEDDNPADYRFLEVNDAFEKHTGMADVEGEKMREMVPEHEDYWYEIYGKVAKTQEPVRFEQSARALGRVLELYAYPFGDPENKKVAVLFNDITERKRNQQKLQEMNETLEEKVEKRTASLKSYQEQLRLLAAELSKTEERERQRLATDLHDNLGQILAVGKMRLEALNRVSDSEDVKEGVDELKSIVDSAIEYSRKLVTELKPPPSLDLENIQESIGWIAEKMQEHGLDVTVEDDGKPKELAEDVRTTIFQCARELLFNVIKHAGVNKARVIMTRPDGFVKVVIEDKGEGFEFTGEQPTPTKEGGFGLFSIRERLNVVGGNMDIASQSGEGTRVTMRVPIKATEGGSETELPQGQVSTSSYPYKKDKSEKLTKVLIVDDHRMMREGLRKMIEDEEDMKVIAEASDGEEAVEMAKEHQVDVIVMDVNMPKLNGIDATEEVIASNPEMRVIGLSFHKEQSVAQAMRDAGASAYLTKSDVFETLCATIRSEVQSAEQQNEEE